MLKELWSYAKEGIFKVLHSSHLFPYIHDKKLKFRCNERNLNFYEKILLWVSQIEELFN